MVKAEGRNRLLFGTGCRKRSPFPDTSQEKRRPGSSANDQWLLVTSANHIPRVVACFRAYETVVTTPGTQVVVWSPVGYSQCKHGFPRSCRTYPQASPSALAELDAGGPRHYSP